MVSRSPSSQASVWMLTGLTNLDMAAGQRDVYGEVDDLGRDGARWRMWFGESSLRRWPRASLDPGALSLSHGRPPARSSCNLPPQFANHYATRRKIVVQLLH